MRHKSLLGRRVRALTHLVPVFDHHLGRGRNPSAVPFDRYDYLGLTLIALDAVALGTGLSGEDGVPRETVVAEMTEAAAEMAPDRPVDEHEHVANFLLDKLLRQGEADTHAQVAYADPDDAWKQSTVQVRLLFETLSYDDHTVLVNADPAAVNLLLVAADLDVEDAQIAAQAVLEAQINSGRLPDAVETARSELQLSRVYASKVRELVAQARRDVTQVGFDDRLAPELDKSAAHLDDRARKDGALLTHVSDAIVDADDPKDVAGYVEIQRLLRESHHVLVSLHGLLIRAGRSWRDAQAGQAFVPGYAGSVEPAQASLDPILTSGTPSVADRGAPTYPQRLLPFTTVVDYLTAPPRERAEVDERAADDSDLVDLEAVWEQFPAVFHDVAQALRQRRIASGGHGRLSALMADATSFVAAGGDLVTELVSHCGDDPESTTTRLRLLLALDALLLWRPEGHPTAADQWWATTDDVRIHGEIDVPDLVVHRNGVQDG
jgi:hypothetical protein